MIHIVIVDRVNNFLYYSFWIIYPPNLEPYLIEA
jgi:hypothetical protein